MFHSKTGGTFRHRRCQSNLISVGEMAAFVKFKRFSL
jgi:hypothetical protein